MRKVLIILLSFVLMLSLGACMSTGRSEPSSSTPQSSHQPGGSSTSVPGQTGGNSSSSTGTSSEPSQQETYTDLTLSGYNDEFEYGTSFTVGDLCVVATLSDGTTKTLDSGEYNVDSTSFNSTQAGEYTIMISAGGVTKSYTVTVKDITITGIAITSSETDYAFAEDLSTDNLVVTASLSNGTSRVLQENEYTVNKGGFNCMKVGTYTITVTANGTNKSASYNVKVNQANKLKVLMIGNSYADDTINHAYEVARATGIDPANIKVADLYIGGCVLNTHWDNWTGNKAVYMYNEEQEGWFKSGGKYDTSLKQGISKEKWDFITFQQGSSESGLADKYNNLHNLMEEVRKFATTVSAENPNANPNVKLVWHQTWAYQADSGNSGFKNYNYIQETMYNGIIDCLQNKVLKEDFAAIIPNGTAIQNARTSLIGDNLSRDNSDHLTHDLGRYIASLNLVKVLTGRDISNVEITESLGGLNADLLKVSHFDEICKESVNNANANPFSVTQSAYPIPELAHLNKLDWQPVGGGYWESSHASYDRKLTVGEWPNKYVCSSVRFTKEDIPVGSVIRLNSKTKNTTDFAGYQYRPDAWVGEYSTPSASRPAEISVQYLVVDDAFWDGYTHRAFNLSTTTKEGSDPASLYGRYEEAASMLEIYVPYETNVNSSYETDKDLFETIDYYTRDYWFPTNGYYAGGASLDIVRTDYTNGPNYVVPKWFTKDTLPVGSVIILDSGYRIRECYATDIDGTITVTRNGNLIDGQQIIYVTEEWWGDYAYRSFNLGPIDTNNVKANSDVAVADHFRIYIPANFEHTNYTSIDWGATQGYYWSASTNADYYDLHTSTSNYVSHEVKFTRETLPIGSVITIASGYEYRPEGWINGARNTNATRPVEVSTSVVFVTEEWWGDWTERAFNVRKKTENTAITVEEAVAAFKIYTMVVEPEERSYFKGLGTSDSPYLIETAEDMAELSSLSYGKNYGAGLYFKLTANITLNSDWQPICFHGVVNNWPESVWYSFEGTFDGDEHSITININKNAYGCGLFSGLSGTVKNLTVNGTMNVAGFSGAVAGKAFDGALIDNVISNVNITAFDNAVGGILGHVEDKATAKVTNCTNNGVIVVSNASTINAQMIGGIVGGGWATIKVVNCTNTASVTGNGRVGGIVGEIIRTAYPGAGVVGCTNSGTITAGTTVATVDNGTNVGKIIGNLVK